MPDIRKVALAACFVAISAPTLAQPAPPPWDDSEDVIVREYVTREAPPAIEFHQTLRPGSIVPEGVPLRQFGRDSTPRLSGMGYFVSVDHKLVVVDPETRVVARILDLDAR